VSSGGASTLPHIQIVGTFAPREPTYDAGVKTQHSSSFPGATPDNSFRVRLQAELARRCTDNPHYSLRALALDLDTDHSTLSQILRGKRALTAAAIEKLGSRLSLDHAAIAAYVVSERLWSAGDVAGEREIRQLTLDTAEIVSDGAHYAILELTRLATFRADTRWVARVLGIGTDEVSIALQRLLRLGLLEMRSPTQWVDLSGHTAAGYAGFTRLAASRLAERVNQLARPPGEARDARPSDHSSTTIAVNAARLHEAIQLIARFRAELVDVLEQDAQRDDVYQLELHLFPLTHTQESETPNHGPTRDALSDFDQEAR
jgi:uncharacterized protein (TIGR02147 family)